MENIKLLRFSTFQSDSASLEQRKERQAEEVYLGDTRLANSNVVPQASDNVEETDKDWEEEKECSSGSRNTTKLISKRNRVDHFQTITNRLVHEEGCDRETADSLKVGNQTPERFITRT